SLRATIGPAPGDPRSTRGGAASPLERLAGADLRDLDRSHPQYGRVQGVYVAAVQPGSLAARAGLPAGLIMLGGNRAAVRAVAELTQALDAGRQHRRSGGGGARAR